MSFSDNKFNIHEKNRPKNNLFEEDEEILETLNISSNIYKNNVNTEINKLLSKENSNENINSQCDIGKREFESDFLGKKNKYIKKYKSDDSRLYGITFQSSSKSDLINIAVSSLNINTNNHISILSFSQEDIFNEDDNIDIINNNINSINNDSICLKSQVQCEFPVSSILFSPHEQNKNLLISTSDILRLYSFEEDKLSLKADFKKESKITVAL